MWIKSTLYRQPFFLHLYMCFQRLSPSIIIESINNTTHNLFKIAMAYTETDALLEWELPEQPKSGRTWPSKRRMFALVVVAAVAASAVGFTSRWHNNHQVDANMASLEKNLHFSVHDAYGEAKYGSEHPFVGDKFVVEPHKVVTLLAVPGKGSKSMRATTFRWVIEGAQGADAALIAFGPEVQVSFTNPGTTHTVKLQTEFESFESEVVSAYVKRELRKMNDHDRETFLDTAAVLWHTPTTEGRALYGDQYTGMDTFVQGEPSFLLF
jgi:hypothetical protein